MGFDISQWVKLTDSLLKYKVSQDKLDLQNDINRMNNDTTIMINEQQNKLTKDIEIEKLNLGANRELLRDQKIQINNIKDRLNKWDISYQDYIELPEDFKSPDGQSVIDEHTGRFKGQLVANHQSGLDTLDMIQNQSDSIKYNTKVLNALNNLEQKYVRGQNFADNVQTDLFIAGVKDGVDLSSTISEFQNKFKADKDMMIYSESDWKERYPNLVDAGVVYDEDMSIDKLNANWQDWEFITNQTVRQNADGMPYIVTRGPEASEFLDSPEWKGLMDQLASETKLTTGAGSDWDTNINLYIQDQISQKILDRSRLGAKNSSVKELKKAIGNRDEWILDGTASYIKTMMKSIDNKIGSSKTNTMVSEDIFDNIKGVVRDWNTMGDDWFSVSNIVQKKEELEQAILNIAKENVDWDLTPDLVDDLINNGDVENLMSLVLHGDLLDNLDGQYGGKGAPFNYYRSSISPVHTNKQFTNDRGGLFKKIDVGKVAKVTRNDGEVIDPGDWYGGLESINYAAGTKASYSQGDASGEAFDFSVGWSDDLKDNQTFVDLLQLYEVIYDLEHSRLLGGGQYGGGNFWNFGYEPGTRMRTDLTGNEMRSIVQEPPVTPNAMMPEYQMPEYLQPHADIHAKNILALQNAMADPDYNPDELMNIEKTLSMLEAYEGFYGRE